MEIQHDTIFVQGLDGNITEEEMAEHFGSIGIIKVRLVMCVGIVKVG